MSHGEGEGSLVLEAREMLATGRDEEEVFAKLAAHTNDWGLSALAVCLAEEDLVSTLLACGHVFVADRVLDGHGERIRDLLWTTACARGGFPGGMIFPGFVPGNSRRSSCSSRRPGSGTGGAHRPSSGRP